MNDIYTSENAIIYIRTSTNYQNDGYSLETQENKCKMYCSLKNLKIKSIFYDKGISGKSIDSRLGIQEALDIVSKRDIFIVYSISQAGRSVKDLIYILDVINKKHAHFTSLSESIDTSTPMGNLIFTIMAGIAEFEHNQTSLLVKDGMKIRKEQHGTANSKARYGYKYNSIKDGDKTIKVELIKNEDEQKVIQLIRELRETPYPFKAIADELTKRKIPTRHNRNKWSTQVVKNILINEGIIKPIKIELDD